MLVLTRKAGENIHIGDQIVISVVRVKGKRAKLGIEAPPSVSVRRQELLFEASNPANTKMPKRPIYPVNENV
jgi:carbon storage regulator